MEVPIALTGYAALSDGRCGSIGYGIATAYAVANPDDKTKAIAAAVCVMGLAGEIGFANLKSGEGNSTLRNRIIDAIYNMDADTLNKGAKYEVR